MKPTLAKHLRDFARDLIGLSGAGLLAFGAYEVYRPAGFIVGGALLLAGAIQSARAN